MWCLSLTTLGCTMLVHRAASLTAISCETTPPLPCIPLPLNTKVLTATSCTGEKRAAAWMQGAEARDPGGSDGPCLLLCPCASTLLPSAPSLQHGNRSPPQELLAHRITPVCGMLFVRSTEREAQCIPATLGEASIQPHPATHHAAPSPFEHCPVASLLKQASYVGKSAARFEALASQ